MWLAFAFLSAGLLGFYDVSKKQSLHKNAVIPVLFVNTVLCSMVFLPMIVLSAFGVIGRSADSYIPEGDVQAHLFIAAKSVLVLSSWLCGYFAIKHLPLTIVGPVNATRPVLTLAGALFVFGERLNLWQWAGVLLAILSFYLLSRSGKKEGIRFGSDRWIGLLVAAAVLGAASGLYDKFLMMPSDQGGLGMHRMFVQGWYNVYQAGLMFIVMGFLWWPYRRHTDKFSWKWSIPLISLFITTADMAYFYALSHPDAMIAVVSMVRRSSVLVSFMVGGLLFHEKNLRSKAFDLLMVFVSMLCLYFGTR